MTLRSRGIPKVKINTPISSIPPTPAALGAPGALSHHSGLSVAQLACLGILLRKPKHLAQVPFKDFTFSSDFYFHSVISRSQRQHM